MLGSIVSCCVQAEKGGISEMGDGRWEMGWKMLVNFGLPCILMRKRDPMAGYKYDCQGEWYTYLQYYIH